MRIPQSIDEITAEWIADALRAGGMTNLPPITAVRTRTIGAARGFMSVTVQVGIDYATTPPEGAPTSLVAKLEPADGSFRDAERRFGAFDREIRFYREVAEQVPLRLPRTYYASASDDGKVLLMEDLCSYSALDQVHGMRHDQVVFTAREVAKLHAAFARPGALDGSTGCRCTITSSTRALPSTGPPSHASTSCASAATRSAWASASSRTCAGSRSASRRVRSP